MQKATVKAGEKGLSSLLLPRHDVLATLSRPCCNRVSLCLTLPSCCLGLLKTQTVLLLLQSHGGSCRLPQGSHANVRHLLCSELL